MNPLVSVILPTYNRSSLLRRAIKSVLVQSYVDYELIIVDDCSIDNTEEVVNSFNDKRIFYYKLGQNTGGSFVPHQVGSNKSNGKYIAILDDDDYWLEIDKLRLQVEYLEKHPQTVLVGTNAITIDAEGDFKNRHSYSQTDSEIRNKLLMQNCFVHSSVVYRRETYYDIGGYHPIKDGYYVNFANEIDLWLRMGMTGKLANLPIYGVAFVYAASKLKTVNYIEFMVKHMKLIKQYKSSYPNHLKAYAWCMITTILEIPILSILKNAILKLKKRNIS